MSKSTFQRILYLIDNHLSRVEVYAQKIIVVVSDEMHLLQENKSVIANTDLYFLYNLPGEPFKVSKILNLLKTVLYGWYDVELLRNEAKEFYFGLMHDAIFYHYKNDPAALLYVDCLINDMLNLIDDDEYFLSLPGL
ncbi:MAG: hypothetical protein GXC73_11965 [Chitinophagaceae bacterium]|nr:hypothetical protein [Chitinophagaceae bacterium]